MVFMSFVFNLAGWICFFLAVKNFLGIGASPEDMGIGVLGLLLPIPDVKTLLFAGGAALFGFLAYAFSKDGRKRGIKVIVCAIICAVLTFTLLANISLIPAMLSYQSEQQSADGYEPIPEGNYKLYAFLGSQKSMPSDVDVMRYIIEGYDGHAEDTYETYKVTGWLFSENNQGWDDVEMTFRLVDEEGNDILSGGEPVILRYEYNRNTMSIREQNAATPEGGSSFQTNTVKAKDLSGIPYGFIVESVKKGYYIDVNDGSKHESPIYH